MVKNDNDVYKKVLEVGLAKRSEIEKTVKQIFDDNTIENIFLVGCGGSLAVMLPCKFILDEISDITTNVYNASEFINLKPKTFTKNSLVIVSSYSGKTPETVKAAQMAKQIGAPTIGFMGKADTPLGEAVDFVFTNHAETGVTDSKIIMLYQIIFNVLKLRGEFDDYDAFCKSLDALPEGLVKIKEKVEKRAAQFAQQNKDEKFFMVLGSGICYGEAYAQATCIFEEMQWIHAQPVHSGEFFHGSFEIVREDTNIILLKGEDLSRPLGERAETFCNKYTKKLTVLDTKEFELEGVDEKFRGYFSPLVCSAVLDRYSKNIADVRNHPLSTRKYMGIVEY
ncbi:MAG TPA: SIS domain-containing protein [Thermotogota bacterium]|nr:SIS domain-containing protein [Thermotogota bacterium]HRW92814.1 SIS domain-containing protein [Thermotogota bacterium]